MGAVAHEVDALRLLRALIGQKRSDAMDLLGPRAEVRDGQAPGSISFRAWGFAWPKAATLTITTACGNLLE
jgi:hypothetical protein